MSDKPEDEKKEKKSEPPKIPTYIQEITTQSNKSKKDNMYDRGINFEDNKTLRKKCKLIIDVDTSSFIKQKMAERYEKMNAIYYDKLRKTLCNNKNETINSLINKCDYTTKNIPAEINKSLNEYIKVLSNAQKEFEKSLDPRNKYIIPEQIKKKNTTDRIPLDKRPISIWVSIEKTHKYIEGQLISLDVLNRIIYCDFKNIEIPIAFDYVCTVNSSR
jgi:hypothetical protein